MSISKAAQDLCHAVESLVETTYEGVMTPEDRDLVEDALTAFKKACQDSGPSHLRERFLDETDATYFGMQWLKALGTTHHADRLDGVPADNIANCASVWRGDTLLGYMLLIRTPINWTEVICHDLTQP